MSGLARRAVPYTPKVNLAAIVKTYLRIAGEFDRPVHLSQFGLTKSETEKIISTLDEDYQISRYLQLSREPDAELTSFPSDARVFFINGHEASHLSFHPDIQKIL